MATYVSLINATNRDVHNAQELAVIWGEITAELGEYDADLIDSYAVLGEHDFLLIFEVPNRESAFKTALTLHRHGLTAQTMEILNTDEFARLVEDI